MQLVEVRGKSTRGLRKVYILFTPDMVAGIKHLLRTRIYAGVHPTNPYVFGRTNTSPLDGCTAMRAMTDACPSLARPELIRSRLLRKYLATTSQIMDMTGDELKLVADHMGHSVAIHTDIYKLQSSLLERTKVARALIALENGQMGKFRGQTLDSISLEELPFENDLESDEEGTGDMGDEEAGEETVQTELPCENYAEGTGEIGEAGEETVQTEKRAKNPKRRWTEEENAIFIEIFTNDIKAKTMPKAKLLENARKRIAGRTIQQIRTRVNNIIKNKQKL